MSTTADSTRHIRTLRRGAKPWHWTALYIGHVQPRGHRTYWRNRHIWQLHLTPIHLHRHGSRWEIGLCWGRRTVYVLRHR